MHEDDRRMRMYCTYILGRLLAVRALAFCNGYKVQATSAL